MSIWYFEKFFMGYFISNSNIVSEGLKIRLNKGY